MSDILVTVSRSVGLPSLFALMGIASFGSIALADGAVIQEVLDIAVIFSALRVW